MADRSPDFYVVIPARFGSIRLPGKPLRKIAGRSMIAHVWERGVESGARQVWVATEDQRVIENVEAFGGRAIMTSAEHTSGTDRIAEVAEQMGWPDDTVVVNLQGDEPRMNSAYVRAVADALRAHPTAGIATLATPIREAKDLFDENVVKVVVRDDKMASYFSRAPIPWVRGQFSAGAGTPVLPSTVPFFRHLGLYAYRVATLHQMCAQAPRANELAEALEQLRGLALGIDIHVSITEDAPGTGVDTEDDLVRVERELSEP